MEYLGQMKIIYLLIIDPNPTKEKCIYSTLLCIKEQTKILNIVSPCITFDQPLDQPLKTVEITKSKSMNVRRFSPINEFSEEYRENC